MVCPRCAKENADENRFCGRCGLDFSKVEAEVKPSGEERPCYRHSKELTALSCGRCGRPICHRCVVIGPAGPRCRDCAKNKIPVSARAVAGDAKIGLKRMLSAGPFALYWWILIASIGFGLVRSCMYFSADRDEGPGYYREAPSPNLPESGKRSQDR